MNKKKSVLVLLVILLVCLFLNPASGSAYVLNKQRMPNPKHINYFNDSSIIKAKMDGYMSYATKWNYSGSQVKVSRSIGAVGVQIKNSYSNKISGTYATTYYTSRQSAKIVYYAAFKKTSTANKRETVVHEVGHALVYHIHKVKITLFLS
ncbi:hypothetical protein [Listeria ivanovii]|uniref:hypothetical protein n=1 Tax=Listeria ivanovii TaxID=1638 RepID=UPI00209BE771|nr:hypothetical protein [Listeria ivanovii]